MDANYTYFINRAEGYETSTEEGLYWINKAADAGLVDAQNLLSGYYLDGRFVDQDKDLGAAYLWQASRHGNLRTLASYMTVSLIPRQADEGAEAIAEEVDQAIMLLKREMRRGSALAAHILGEFYRRDLVVGATLEEAEKWYEIAIQGNWGFSKVILAQLIQRRPPAQRDLFRARMLVLSAAEQGQREGMVEMGRMLRGGIGGDRDLTQSRYWYERAAKGGHVLGQTKLAELCLNGIGGPVDNDCAHENAAKAHGQGSREATALLAQMYLLGRGVDKNTTRAAELFEQAAESGNATALFRLSGLYFDGDGVDQDTAKALDYLQQAAERGHLEALHSLGLFHIEGTHVDKDVDAGLPHVTKAANAGYSKSLAYLGNAYYRGDIVGRDMAQAFDYYKKLAEGGVYVAQYQLGRMYEGGEGVTADLAQAVHWYEQSGLGGNRSGMFRAGVIYAEGPGVVKPDLQKAYLMFLLVERSNVTEEARTIAENALAAIKPRLGPDQLANIERRARAIALPAE